MGRPRPLAPLVALLALLVTLGACGWSQGTTSGTEPPDAADVAFAARMVPHHEQALQMVALARGHRTPAALDVLMQRIRDTQRAEIAQMRGWLRTWADSTPDASDASGDGMARMAGMEGPGDAVAPRMIGRDDLARLAAADGSRFVRTWLRLMIAHHERAVEMARTELDHGSYPPALELAESIIESQSAQIDRMQRMLEG